MCEGVLVVDPANVAFGSGSSLPGREPGVSGVNFTKLQPVDLLEIARQPSQDRVLGLAYEWSEAEGQQLCAEPVAWTARADGRIIACFGISETFEGLQGWGWAVLATGIGGAHLALTRFMRSVIAECGLARLEVLARAVDLEAVIATAVIDREGPLDSGQLVALAMARPTPECRWAALLGLQPAHVLRRYGAASESYMLFERIGLVASANVRCAAMPTGSEAAEPPGMPRPSGEIPDG